MVRQLGSTVEEIVALREKLQAFTRRTVEPGEDGLNLEV